MTYLYGEIRCHGVDIFGQVLPLALNIGDLGLATKRTIRTDLSGHFAHFNGERAQAVHHLVDGILELQNLSLDLDANLLGKVAPGDGRSDLGNLSHLCGEVHGHAVDVFGKISPCALDIVDRGLATQASLCSDFSGDLGDLASKLLQLVNHGVDGGLELEHFSPTLGLDFLCEVSLGDGCGDLDNVAHLGRQIVGHGVDVDGQIVPHALDAPNVGLSAQYTLGSDISCYARDFGCKCSKLVHHGVYGLLELQDFSLCWSLNLLCQIAVSDGCCDGGNFPHWCRIC